MRLGAKVAWIVAGVSAVLLVSAWTLPRWARRRAMEEAAKRRVSLDVGGVWPGFGALHLRDVAVRADGLDGASARIETVTVKLDWTLRPRAIVAEGVRLELDGEPDVLRDRVRAWREGQGGGSSSSGRVMPVAVRQCHVHWHMADSDLEVDNLHVDREADATRVGAQRLALAKRHEALEMLAWDAEFDAAHKLRSAHVAECLVRHAGAPGKTSPASSSTTEAEETPLPPLPVPVVLKTKRPTPVTKEATKATLPSWHLPDPAQWRPLGAQIAAKLRDAFAEDATVTIDAMRFELGGESDRLRLGPGALEAAARGNAVQLAFRSQGHGEIPGLALEAKFPLDLTQIEVALSGGPVPLTALGVAEGTMGVTTPERSRVSGKGRVYWSERERALTFDTTLDLAGLSIHRPELSKEPIVDLAMGVRARGALRPSDLRLDDAEFSVGALHVVSRGTLETKDGDAHVSLRFEVPIASCQSLLESIPPGLLPTLRGSRMAGTFSAKGQLTFDRAHLDDLALDYAIDDECRMTAVPETLLRERFRKEFKHKVQLPDGKAAELSTGPGSDHWVELDRISPFMQVAVLTTEDGAFFRHHGFNHAAIRNSLVANLKAGRFARGASTITMQLAKNLFLARDKTLSRKLEEVILSDYLEQAFGKDEMMELYLNVIEFGPGIYGVKAAADHYFARHPEELSLSESLFLASLLPSPLRYHRLAERPELSEGWTNHLRQLMKIALKTGKISDAEYQQGLSEKVAFQVHEGPRPIPRAPVIHTHFTGGAPTEDDWIPMGE